VASDIGNRQFAVRAFFEERFNCLKEFLSCGFTTPTK
jgi:hypothetical protein